MKNKLWSQQAFDPQTKKLIGTVSIPMVDDDSSYALIFFSKMEILMKKNISINLLFALVERMDKKNVVYLNSINKAEIAKSIEIRLNSLDVYLTKMVNQNVIARIGLGTYMIDPDYFVKGSIKKRGILRVTFEAHLIDPENKLTPSINLVSTEENLGT